MNPNLTFTVSEYIATLNAALKTLEAKVTGEVIKTMVSSKGHVYFTLKDKDHDAVIDCVMWAYSYKLNGVRLEAGMEVIVSGSAQMYAPTGRMSFHSKTIELVGEGALKRAYEKLKQELTQEGLMSNDRKRSLPDFPHRIGVITSKQGAVIHDFSNNLGTWGFAIKFVDSRVEGKEALYDLLQAIKTLKKQNLDILIIMRGGGSMQSLAAFDNESVVRAIADFPVPVIAAIGHHQDVPLAALVADKAVSTPTAAAILVGSTWEDAEKSLDANTYTIKVAYQELLHEVALTLQLRKESIAEKFAGLLRVFSKASDRITKAVTRMRETVQFNSTNIRETHTRLANAYARRINAARETLQQTPKYYAVFAHVLTDNQTYLTHYFKDVSLDPSIQTAQHHLSLQWNERIKRSFTFAIQAQKPMITDDTIFKSFITAIQQNQTSLTHCEQIITLNNPMRLLQHGYSILKNGERLVKRVEDVTIGDSVEVLVSDGTIRTKVSATQKQHG